MQFSAYFTDWAKSGSSAAHSVSFVSRSTYYLSQIAPRYQLIAHKSLVPVVWVVRSTKPLTLRGAEFELQCPSRKVGNLRV